MKRHLDMAKIAKGLGALRRGKVHAEGGYLGALGLAAHVGRGSAYVKREGVLQIHGGRIAASLRLRPGRSGASRT